MLFFVFALSRSRQWLTYRFTMAKRFSFLVFTISVLMTSACAKEPDISSKTPEEELARCVRLSEKKKYEEAIGCLEILKSRFPRSRAGQDAELKIGDAYYQQKEYLLAAETYVAFIRLYPRGQNVDYAHYRAGAAYFRASPKAIDRDQEYLDDAITHLKTVVHHHPQSAYRNLSVRFLKDAERRVAKRNFYVGKFYSKTGEYLAALPRLRVVTENDGGLGLAPKASYMMIHANLELGHIDAAKEVYGKLSLEFPESKWTEKAKKRLLHAAKKSAKS